MKLNTAPQHVAQMSNVVTTGEFRIRNSAKAFNILSSGLYANKIRAVIRELGCNAADSHTAAGCSATPFDLHLPTQLEPWFAIRDYGVGLDHEQVTNIYTTYFESTKTDSNDYIGALGLGSKSPFSYTDNFTVTAVKSGVRRIYTAYINDQGIPSIVLMAEETSAEPEGVEVRFAVNSASDYIKFQQEARQVLAFFPQQPVVNIQGFEPVKYGYVTRDIIPGVHHYSNDQRSSTAVMGMIAYPIVVPNPEQNLGDLAGLLKCGLELNFGIGELDFQASREGLSYVAQTIDSIRSKLEQLNQSLYTVLKKEADATDCLWRRAILLAERLDNPLWSAAAKKYVADTGFALVDLTHYHKLRRWSISEEDLASKYNARITAFSKLNHELGCSNIKPNKVTIKDPSSPNGHRDVLAHGIQISKHIYFVEVDTKVGALQRAKTHWRENRDQFGRQSDVYVISAHDRKRPLLFSKLMRDLSNPPLAQQFKASDLDRAATVSRSWGSASVMTLTEKTRSRNSQWVWSTAGTAKSFDPAKTHYYVELDGWSVRGLPTHDIKDFRQTLSQAGVFHGTIHGVRRKDIDLVKTQANWVNLNDHVKTKLAAVNMDNVMSLVKDAIDYKTVFRYASDQISSSSPYYQLYAEFKDVTSMDYYRRSALERLLAMYKLKVQQTDPSLLIQQYKSKVAEITARYPMLQYLSNYGVSARVVADYIYLVDSTATPVV